MDIFLAKQEWLMPASGTFMVFFKYKRLFIVQFTCHLDINTQHIVIVLRRANRTRLISNKSYITFILLKKCLKQNWTCPVGINGLYKLKMINDSGGIGI